MDVLSDKLEGMYMGFTAEVMLFFTSVLCKIIDVMIPFSEVE